jgi:hypothetical protein
MGIKAKYSSKDCPSFLLLHLLEHGEVELAWPMRIMSCARHGKQREHDSESRALERADLMNACHESWLESFLCYMHDDFDR